jgi:cell division protein ZapA (FtsZ GTPase activity inhibitor)
MPAQPERTGSEAATARAARPGGLRPRFREKLPELLLEAVSVVFAVLLALAVDEWRETRSRNALAARARASILEEIRSNDSKLRNTRDSNRALLQRIEETLSRVERREPEISLEFNFKIALLSSAAWQTAQMTQAANLLDFDWLRGVSNAYELQGIYLTSQSAVVDRISGISEILEDDPQRMLTIIAERLRANLSIQDSVLEEYAKVLKAEP